MSFRQIAAAMGIDTYPAEMDAIYVQGAKPLVTRQMLCDWQERLQLFGEYFDDVLRGFDDLQTKPAELAWTNAACRYIQTATCAEARSLTMPKADGSPARDMIPLFLLLSRVEWAMAEYVRRGFTQEQARQLMDVFPGNFRTNLRSCGRPGVNQARYNWSVLIMYCALLPCRGFKFDIRKNPKTAMLLRNKESGETAVLVFDVSIHKTGHRLGTAGCTDEDGAFIPTLEETDTAWIGYAADKEGLLHPEKKAFCKSQWEIVAKPGDDILGIHIPKGADIRPEAVRYAVDGVRAHIREFYPEHDIKAIHCSSWMLNPELGELAGKQSRLAAFSDLFCRYPTVSNGKAVFGFVFGTGANPELSTLPENTSLQRAFKKRYLDGGYIHAFNGYLL